jgi:hypothetical protein
MTITRGVIDDDSIHAYRSGQCVALGQAISERTGWPLMLIFNESSKRQARKWHKKNVTEWRIHYESEHGTLQGWSLNFTHALVKAPNGTLIDIKGWDLPRNWVKMYSKLGPCFLLEANLEDTSDLMSVGRYPYVHQPWQNMELAHEFVPLVLERVGYGHLVA